MGIERTHYSLLGAICASLFCTPLMLAGINAVLPEIGSGIGAGATQLSLVGTVYALGLAVFQLACGTLGDICGHRRLFVAGGLIFAISGIILGFTYSVPLFLAMRFTQGVGGAILSATGLALLASCAPQEQRAAYLGLSGAAVYSGIACGAPIAGFIAGFLGWRWIFWLSAAAIFIISALMRYKVGHEWRPAPRQSFDLGGCAIYAGAMGGLTLGVAEMAKNPLYGWLGIGSMVFFGIFFCFHEFKCQYPVLNIRLLAKNRVLALSSLAAFVNYASFFGLTFYFGIYVQVGKGLGVRLTGLILALQPLFQALCTPIASRLCQRCSYGVVSAAGAALCGAGLIAGAFLQIDSPLAILFLAQVLLGCGISFFSLGNTAIILESAGTSFIGQASGLTGAVRTAGQLCSMALITLTLGWLLGGKAVDYAAMGGFMRSMHINLAAFAAFNLLAIGLSLARNRNID